MTHPALRFAALVGLCALLHAGAARADTPASKHYSLDLTRARELARARAPAVRLAAAAIEVRRGRLRGASMLQRHNPWLMVGVGPRFSEGPTALDVNAMLMQRLQIGGQRAARIASARADVVASRALLEESTRRALAAVSRAFARALYARAALAVARDGVKLARQLYAVAAKRLAVGDVGTLDVNVARAALARTQARQSHMVAQRARAIGSLRALLDIEAHARLSVDDNLSRRRRYALDQLLEHVARRPDLRVLAARVKHARARRDLGRSQRWPDLGVFARYGREGDSEQVLVGGLRLYLPIFNRGQGLRATGTARARVATLQLRLARRRAATEVRTAHRVFTQLDKAARSFGARVLPRLMKNLELAQKSYRSGAMPIAQLLLLQRETIEARHSHVQLLLRVALAAVDLEAKAGVWK